MVIHGGCPSTLDALRHGVPLVVLRLFSSDQRTTPPPPRASAGIALDAGVSSRTAAGAFAFEHHLV